MPGSRSSGRRIRKGAGDAGASSANDSANDSAQAKSRAKSSSKSLSKKGAKKKRNQEPRTPYQYIQQLAKWVDLIIEVLDGRLPDSTRHPNADSIFGNKPRLFIFTKEDLADVNVVKEKVALLQKESGSRSVLLSLKRSTGREKIINFALEATREKQEALARKGILPRPMRICVVGLPNVGKSSLINWLIGSKKAKTGNKPGITQGTQWVRVHPKLELLDTPGILPPTGFGQSTKLKLAALNLLPQSNYEIEPVAEEALLIMKEKYPELLNRYVADLDKAEDGFFLIANRRNMIGQGAIPDRLRACTTFLTELREGKLGRITLD